jgi:pyruvate/2-oxoglutarate dehydrogenase complex dihydrolipoamide dehydrogenase (E3) component
VIGSGSAGSAAAAKCNNAGWSVAMIDQKPFGGTCALRGCDPKKVLVGAAELIEWNERMNGNGLKTQASIKWEELIQFKRTFTEDIPKMKEESLNKQGIDTYHGRASFMSKNELRVNDEVLKGKHILIASGAKPAPLNIKGEEHLTYSEGFMELNELPKRIVFVGGGYISSAVFIVPKMASVGMREDEIKASGRNIKVNFTNTSDWFTHKRTNEDIAAFKVLIDEDKDHIVGAHLISSEADELINHFATAIRFQISTKD